MTNQAIVPAENNQLADIPEWGDRQVIREMCSRLKLMIVNGKKLDDNEAMALAQYSRATGLDPFTGECYMLPGVGPGPGIAGWRRKAHEQLEYEAERGRVRGGVRFWVETLPLTTEEQENLKIVAGDVGCRAVLHDSMTRNDWEARIVLHSTKYIQAGLQAKDAIEAARALVGDEPVWCAYGVVRAGENFGPDKWPRPERAAKRAEKGAIRKRFPRVKLPEPESFDGGDPDVIIEHVPTVAQELAQAFTGNEDQPRRDSAEIMSDLGFG